jgi:hypothetical protein
MKGQEQEQDEEGPRNVVEWKYCFLFIHFLICHHHPNRKSTLALRLNKNSTWNWTVLSIDWLRILIINSVHHVRFRNKGLNLTVLPWNIVNHRKKWLHMFWVYSAGKLGPTNDVLKTGQLIHKAGPDIQNLLVWLEMWMSFRRGVGVHPVKQCFCRCGGRQLNLDVCQQAGRSWTITFYHRWMSHLMRSSLQWWSQIRVKHWIICYTFERADTLLWFQKYVLSTTD